MDPDLLEAYFILTARAAATNNENPSIYHRYAPILAQEMEELLKGTPEEKKEKIYKYCNEKYLFLLKEIYQKEILLGNLSTHTDEALKQQQFDLLDPVVSWEKMRDDHAKQE